MRAADEFGPMCRDMVEREVSSWMFVNCCFTGEG